MNSNLKTRGRFRRGVIGSLLVAALVGAGLTVFPALGIGEDEPKPSNPFAGLPKEERVEAERSVEAAHAAAQPAFIDEFLRSGADLHSLDVVNISRLVVSSRSLLEATNAVDAGVRGTVVAQHLDRERGRVVSKVRVDDVVFGAADAVVSVSQVGSPQLNGDRKVLVQVADDPLLRKDKEYLLLLGACDGPVGPGESCLTGGGRQFEIRNGAVLSVTEGAWPAELNGSSIASLISQIRSHRSAP